jgi:hypothetical protein
MTEVVGNIDLAHAMIEVHGSRAAGVARENARAAAVAGQVAPAKNWLKVVEAIQRQTPVTLKA